MSSLEVEILLKLLLSLIIGGIIGYERESRGKYAGISTHSLVIAGSMIFTIVGIYLDPNEPARLAAQIITGIGFLGAGIILQERNGKILNLTTAASIWFSAGIGMCLALNWYLISFLAMFFSVFVPRIPHQFKVSKK